MSAVGLAGLVALSVGCAIDAPPRASGPTTRPAAPAATAADPAQWVETTTDVDGVSIVTRCAGAGDRTVVFISAIGEDGATGWGNSGVPDRLKDRARVCTYDRPGLGASGPAATPRTLTELTRELKVLVSAGALPAPVVLVAQGSGTFMARQFGAERPRDVAGIVLVDPPLETLDATPPAGAPAGVIAEYEAIRDLNDHLGAYGAGAMPPPPVPYVVVITGDRPPLPPTVPEGGPTTRPTVAGTTPPTYQRDERRAGQQQLARKGPFGKVILLDDSGSYAQYWDPAAVADAVGEALGDG